MPCHIARLNQTVQPKYCDFLRGNFFQEFLVGLGRGEEGGKEGTRVSLSLPSMHTGLFIEAPPAT